MLEDIVQGTLKKLFTKNGEGQEIDFAENSKAEAIIGLADLLDVSQTYVKVFNKKTGEFIYGVRGIKSTKHRGVSTPSYINMKTGKYIEILDGYTIETISEEDAKKQITFFNTNVKNNLYHKDKVLDEGVTPENIETNEKAKESLRTTYAKKKEESIAFLNNAFESGDKTDLKSKLESMTGEDYRAIISSIGHKALKDKIKKAGILEELTPAKTVKDGLKATIASELSSYQSSDKNNVYKMMYAILQQEHAGENFKQFDISDTGSAGIGQITQENARIFNKNPFNIEDNLSVGVQLFKENYERALKKGLTGMQALERAAMEYFAGPKGADNPNQNPPGNKINPNQYLAGVKKYLDFGRAEDIQNWKDYEKQYNSGKYTPVNEGAKEESSIDLTSSSEIGSEIAKMSMEMVDKKDRQNKIKGTKESREFSCWEWANEVYQRSGIDASNRQVLYQGKPYSPIGEQISQAEIKNSIKVGDWLYIHNGNGIDKRGDHSVIFLGWTDSSKTTMRTASFPGSGSPRFKNYTNKEIRHVTRAKAGGELNAKLMDKKVNSEPEKTETGNTTPNTKEKEKNYKHPALEGALEQAIKNGINKEQAKEIIKNQAVISVKYRDMNNVIQTGEIVIHKNLAKDIKGAFQATLKANQEAGYLKYPIAKIAPINKYNWSDEDSMQNNNSSGFNPRTMTGSTKLSMHAKGMAIDINPIQNPYIKFNFTKQFPLHKKNTIEPKEFLEEFAITYKKLGYGENFYKDRNTINVDTYNRVRSEMKGSLDTNHPMTKYFKNNGWTWGGDWSSIKDTQHFEKATN